MKKIMTLLLCAMFSSFSFAEMADKDNIIGISGDGIVYCDFSVYDESYMSEKGQLRVQSMPFYGVWQTTSPYFVFDQYFSCKKEKGKWELFNLKGNLFKGNLYEKILIKKQNNV